MSDRPRPVLRRDPRSALIAGVCAGLGNRIGIDPVLIRVGFICATVASGGLAAVAYAVLWAVLPADADGRSERGDGGGLRARRPARAGGWAMAAGSALIVLGLLVAFRELGIWWSDALVWPVVLAAGGATLIWRQAAGRLGPYRGGFGVALVIGAAILFLYAQGALGPVRDAALAALVVLVGLGLVLAPFWVRLGRSLDAERSQRIRSQERAEMAAHLHDSVLQTLALVQKRADDPRQVSTLVRRQERELRDWLSGGGRGDPETGLAAALESAAVEVEQRHEVPIDAVTVGERPLEPHGEALVAATREALTNAARFAGESGPIALYAEIGPRRAQVFVHDRGDGFDPDLVPGDRRGVRDSIIARMRRHGGDAVIRSSPGEGTEVELTVEAG